MQKLIIIAGPTASGKSDAAVRIARAVGGSIISADSMQVYRGMDIGSAKITKDEMQGIPHELIDVIDPEEEWNVVKFQAAARKCIEEIAAGGRIPILAGGTGFYIQSVLYDISFTQMDTDEELRRILSEVADGARSVSDVPLMKYFGISPGQDGELQDSSKAPGNMPLTGTQTLYRLLQIADPAAAQAIHPNNVKRVIRALEFSSGGAGRISEHNLKEQSRPPAYDAVYFVLTMDREKLYRRIDKRVDAMMEAGLVSEVRGLMDRGLTIHDVSMQGLGYRQVIDALEGRTTMEEAIRRIKTETRHFAKRQLTWFKREEIRNPAQVIWVDRDGFEDTDEMISYMIKTIEERFAADRHAEAPFAGRKE